MSVRSWNACAAISRDRRFPQPAEKRGSMTWAMRLKRVFDINIETCSECGGDVRNIAGKYSFLVLQGTMAGFLNRRPTVALKSVRFSSAQKKAPPKRERLSV